MLKVPTNDGNNNAKEALLAIGNNDNTIKPQGYFVAAGLFAIAEALERLTLAYSRK